MYLKWGPHQMHLASYPLSGIGDHRARFQYSWFSIFPTWLEYSPLEDVAYCLPCYLFSKRPSECPELEIFIATGFRIWRKMNNGKNHAFLKHIGKDSCSPHNNTMKACGDLLIQKGHIKNVIHVQCLDQIMKNRLCLKTSINTIYYLKFEAYAFSGHVETSESRNQDKTLIIIQ